MALVRNLLLTFFYFYIGAQRFFTLLRLLPLSTSVIFATRCLNRSGLFKSVVLTAQTRQGLQLGQYASFSLSTQCFEARDDIEQFFVDTTLAQTMECPVEVLQQFINIFVGALHRRQATRVLARKRFGARPE